MTCPPSERHLFYNRFRGNVKGENDAVSGPGPSAPDRGSARRPSGGLCRGAYHALIILGGGSLGRPASAWCVAFHSPCGGGHVRSADLTGWKGAPAAARYTRGFSDLSGNKKTCGNRSPERSSPFWAIFTKKEKRYHGNLLFTNDRMFVKKLTIESLKN